LRPWRTQEQWEPRAIDSVRLRLYSSLLAENMAPKLFDDAVVGSSYEVRYSGTGLNLAFSGFPELVSGLVDRVLAEMLRGVNNFSVPRFNRVQHDMIEDLRSYSEMPVQYAIEDRGLLLTTGTHSKEEILTALREVDLGLVTSAATDLLLSEPLELTALAMGNLEETLSRNVLSTLMDGLQAIASVGQKEGNVTLVTPVVKPGKPVELRKQNPRRDDPNHVAVVSLLAGVSTVESRVIFGILGQMLSQLAYNELRTEKQLGYVVNAGDVQISNVQAISIVVQGNVLDADSMEAAIEHVYFHSMPQRLAELTDDEFKSYKAAFKHQLLEPPLDVSEEFAHWWGLVSMHGACLGLRNEMLTYLEKLVDTKDSLSKAWSRLIFPESGVRLKIAVKYFAGQVPRRASEEEASALWKKFGISGPSIDILTREHDHAIVQNNATSTGRAELAKSGGYFPLELHCALSEEVQPKQNKSTELLADAPLVTQRRLRTRSQIHESLGPR